MKNRVLYFIRVRGETSSFCADRYSKFYARLSAKSAGKLRGLIYGPKQAREHIAELRRSVYQGKREYLHKEFEIVREVTTETVIATL